MCETCGCSDGAQVTVVNLGSGEAVDGAGRHHAHAHDHEGHHHHSGDHRHDHGHTVSLEQAVLARNDALAERNRASFAGRGILALNLVSGPGAGKTTLLERTLRDLRERHSFFVIEGDQATSNDGERIRATGAPVVQVNTGSGCHLDADMVARGVGALRPAVGAVLMIENVGNLVCPSLFDLGESAKVAILSLPEGEDKPVKYPHMFRAARLLLINKIDLLPHLDFDLDRCVGLARQVNPEIEILLVSASTGEGLSAWYAWVATAARRVRGRALPAPAEAAP